MSYRHGVICPSNQWREVNFSHRKADDRKAGGGVGASPSLQTQVQIGTPKKVFSSREGEQQGGFPAEGGRRAGTGGGDGEWEERGASGGGGGGRVRVVGTSPSPKVGTSQQFFPSEGGKKSRGELQALVGTHTKNIYGRWKGKGSGWGEGNKRLSPTLDGYAQIRAVGE
jgi:hypothetical protein